MPNFPRLPTNKTTEPKPARQAVAFRRAPAGMQSRFDAAQTGSQNREHWAAADDLSPNLATAVDVRRTLRRRARYERDNDPHLDGLTKTLAYDMIGTGPRLQLTVPVELHDSAMVVMKAFAAWVRAAGIAEKLRLMVEPRPTDGETFGQFINNESIPHPVKLDLAVMESEQIATPFWGKFEATAVDGIEYDSSGNPTFYHVLKEHPGDSWTWDVEVTKVPAAYMTHWFRARRPGQGRGVSEFASSLPIGAQTRRYAKAVLSAAEFAASISGVMKTESPVDTEEQPDFATMGEVDAPHNALLSLPAGYDAMQFKAEQPTGTYKEFVGDKRSEMGRPVLAPFNVVTGNSAGYNYSSGRLDHVPYHRVVWIERERFRNLVLDKLFLAWCPEARVNQLIPEELGPVESWAWEWQWDGFVSIDPLKDATAIELRLRLNLTTLSEECAADGRDWREVVDQRAIEREYMRSKGMPVDADGNLALGPDDPEGESTLVENEDGTTSPAPKTAGAGAGVVADTALNGAQIASLVLVCDKLALKLYPASAAEEMLQVAFPAMDKRLIASIVKNIDKHKPPAPPAGNGGNANGNGSNGAAPRNGQAAALALIEGLSLDDVAIHPERNGVKHV